MPIEVVVPPVSNVEAEEGIVVAWFKKEGAQVKEGERLLELQMEKVSLEVPAPASGRLVKILAPKGEVVRLGQTLGLLARPGEEVPGEEAPEGEGEAAEAAPTAREERPFVPASPAARRLAQELGVDLAALSQSVGGRRITEEDVRVAAQAAAPAEEEAPEEEVAEAIALAGMRGAIARRMRQSLDSAAPVTLTTEVDVTELVRRHQALRGEAELTYTDFLVRAAALSLREHPRLNGTVGEQEIRLSRSIHIGLAVALEEGLVVPVLRSADRLDLQEIARASRELVERARSGKLTVPEMTGGTFTITNLGAYDVDAFTPIIDPPQIAILGVGRIREKPAVRDGELVARHMLTLSLTFDHRAVDGAPAAAFLKSVKERLESAESL